MSYFGFSNLRSAHERGFFRFVPRDGEEEDEDEDKDEDEDEDEEEDKDEKDDDKDEDEEEEDEDDVCFLAGTDSLSGALRLPEGTFSS